MVAAHSRPVPISSTSVGVAASLGARCGASDAAAAVRVGIVAASSLRIQNNLANMVASADLQLQGTYDRPLLFGRAEIDRGDVLFEGNRYIVTPAAASISSTRPGSSRSSTSKRRRASGVPGKPLPGHDRVERHDQPVHAMRSTRIRRCPRWTSSRSFSVRTSTSRMPSFAPCARARFSSRRRHCSGRGWRGSSPAPSRPR